MSTSHRPHDTRRPADPLDRLIDEAVAAELRTGPVDLRAQVLARLDEPVGKRRVRGLGWLAAGARMPALLPVAGALVMVVAIGALWQRANDQLGRNTFQSAARGGAPLVPGPPAVEGTTPAPAAGSTAESPVAEPPSGARDARTAAARPAKSPAWLEADDERKEADLGALLVDPIVEEVRLPGAPAGDLGDPIAPMPRPEPIVIQPIATPPIPEAPPVSTLARPVGTLTGEVSRDRQDPGKPGGM
jgi:hypothetical protein